MLILLDHSRALRGARNSCTVLKRLFNQAAAEYSFQLMLYHTPYLRGLLKRVLPSRWNEVIGVQHMKLYIFDDSVLVSGANLSDTYFTNRQDRYILIENCQLLADYFDAIVRVVASCSFEYKPDGSVSPVGNHPVRDDLGKFVGVMRGRVKNVMERWKNTSEEDSNCKSCDTDVYPLIQMGPLGIGQEDYVIRKTFSSQSPRSTMNLTSGYFNLTQTYADLLLKWGKYKLKILSSSPQGNAFFNGHGLSYYIPAFYTYVAKQFFEKMVKLKQENRVSMHEFNRQGWSFHAKGLWWTCDQDLAPSATFIGSSNFGYRSLKRDLEAQLVIVTRNSSLQQQLLKEQSRLFGSSSRVESSTFAAADHYVPLWIRFISRFVRNFF